MGGGTVALANLEAVRDVSLRELRGTAGRGSPDCANWYARSVLLLVSETLHSVAKTKKPLCTAHNGVRADEWRYDGGSSLLSREDALYMDATQS